MVTDYLWEMFPPYKLTEDTAVIPFKHYFRKEGDGFSRVVILNATNPKTAGWYEASRNHYEEFRHHCDSIKVNNIGIIAQMTLDYLIGNDAHLHIKPGFPKTVLPRVIDGVDWSLDFNDIDFNEVVGSTPVPPYAVTFADNLNCAMVANQLVMKIVSNISNITSVANWKARIVDAVSFNLTNFTATTIPPNKTYGYAGYTLNLNTLGNPSRSNDVYTLLSLWGGIPWRESLMVLQDAAVKLKTMCNASNMNYYNSLVEFMKLFDLSARTVAHISKLVNAVVIDVSCKLTDGTVATITDRFRYRIIHDVPASMVIDGTSMYKLEFGYQLAPGAIYCQVVSDWSGNLIPVGAQVIPEPSVALSHVPVRDTGTFSMTGDMQYAQIQDGLLWYTSVPFSS